MDIMRGRNRHFGVVSVRLALVVLAVVSASLPACSRSDNAVSGNTINVTEADNERALTLASGDRLVVSLASTPGTGFGWKVADVDGKVLRETGAPALIPNPHPMPGAPATQVFRFVATGSGSAGLELDYVRPWEKGAAPARTFHLGVTVR
jgi:inhibitor of cysteine peptidase